MLCPGCHVHTQEGFPFCLRCGRALRGASIDAVAPSELHPVAAPDVAFALDERCVTIGRAPDNDLVVDDGRASRYHARIWREHDGYRLEDLDSLNGTRVGDTVLRGIGRRLDDGDVIGIGRAEVRFEQPRPVEVGGRTVYDASATRMLGDEQVAGVRRGEVAAPAGPLEVRPRRRSGWALKQVPSTDGEVRYVLRHTASGRYVQLTDRDRFLWDRLDGESTVRDLLFAYAAAYGQLALPRIQQLLGQLAAAGLITTSGQSADAGVEPSPLLRRLGRTVFHGLMRMELSIRGIDGVLARLYRSVGWRFFSPAGLVMVWTLVGLGIVAFVRALGRVSLLDVGGAGAWGVVATLGGYVAALTVHELAHGLATKSYGRRVRRGGFMVMMAMPFAFVDTSDMWLEGRRARIVVSLAGPVATAALGGVFSILAAVLPAGAWPAILFHIAFGLYINTLFNFNPLIPLDGYYVLIDWLGIPRLREEAAHYARVGVWRDLRQGRLPRDRRRLGLLAYGVASLVGTAGFLVLGVLVWRSRLGGLVHDHVRPPFDSLVIVAGLLLVMLPVWSGPLLRILRVLRARRRVEVREVDLEASPA
jgi:putative peptide zinc metalloprotease protein